MKVVENPVIELAGIGEIVIYHGAVVVARLAAHNYGHKVYSFSQRLWK